MESKRKRLFPLGLEDRDGLNRKMGGGLPIGSIILMEGGYGAGKSSVTQRIAYGLCETGHHVCYGTPELDLMSFLEQMNSLNYDIEEHILTNKFSFFNPTFDQTGENYVKKLLEAEKIWNGNVTIIDAFDQFLRNDQRFDSLVKQNKEEDISSDVVSFFRDLIRADKSIIITMDPSNLSKDALSPFRSVADVYFKLETIDVGGETRRSIDVKRFSGMGKQVGDTIGFSVRADIGIVIESREVV